MNSKPEEFTPDPMSQLYGALINLQKVVKDPDKTKTAEIVHDNGKYTFKYADLVDVLKVARDVMPDLGLALFQTTKVEGNMLVVSTTVAHSAGGSISSDYPACAANEKPKVKGAAITYARRYSASIALGVSSVDDSDYQGASALRMSSHRAKQLLDTEFLQSEIHDADHKKLDKIEDELQGPLSILPVKWIVAIKDKIEHRRQELDKINYGENGELLFKDEAAE